MTRSQHSRGRVLFEVLCILALGGSFAAAWLQTGVTAHLASAAIAGVYGVSRTLGLFARPVAAAVAEPVPVAASHEDIVDSAPPRIEIFAFEPEEIEAEPAVALEPVKEAKSKRRKKARAADRSDEAAVEEPKVVAFVEPVLPEIHIEPLFEPQPFVRQPRAFGRKTKALPAG